ncbi:ABC transporter substrate-binding protein [Virgisporangium aliadipatigenens]|uniref:ABC transporter substrate-binding protein n=1 Tax=Virgisporangium aliadipatigenens TaxID=741659 RepID=A0A8J4DTR8_9ACTN|nr:ABC transporter substrate-binding protein [Virgisporangium aliadipatigenens]GIJ49586.1 ABC transporter substrate-binding protein [Virgisporangium aliadipatigenens]
MTPHRRSGGLRRGLLAVAVAGHLALAACAGNGAGGSTNSFTLSYGVPGAGVVVPFKKLAEQYMNDNPGVKITLNEVPNDTYGQSLTTQLNGGNASDAFQTAPGSGQTFSLLTLATAGHLAPLDDAAAARIPSGSNPLFQHDGRTYGVALGLTVVSSIFNDSTARSLGVAYPTEWGALLSACAALAKKDKSFYTVAGAVPANTGLMAVSLSATRVYAQEPDWNQKRAVRSTTFAGSQGWRDTLQAIVAMKDAGCFQKGAAGAGLDAIGQRTAQGASLAAFAPSSTAMDLKQAAKDATFLIQPVPAAPGGKAFALAGAIHALSINKNAKNGEAARKFADWVASDAGQKLYAEASGSLLPGTDLSGTAFAPVADLVAKKDMVPLPNTQWPNPQVFAALGTGVQGLLTGQRTPADVLSAMDTAWG